MPPEPAATSFGREVTGSDCASAGVRKILSSDAENRNFLDATGILRSGRNDGSTGRKGFLVSSCDVTMESDDGGAV